MTALRETPLWALLACSLCLARSASAQGEPARPAETYSLSFVRGAGAESCPSKQELEREVSTRLGHSPFESNAQKSIEILTERTSDGYRSVITAIDRDGKVLGRRVLLGEESSCAPIFSATALAVALLIDPEAALSRDARANEAVGRFEVEEPPPPPTIDTASKAPLAPAVAPTPAPPPPAPSPPPAPPPPPRESPVASVGADIAVAMGFVPEVSPAFGMFAEGFVSPRWGFSLSALYVAQQAASQGDAILDVSLTTFGASLSLAAVATRSFRLVPDAGLLAGPLHVAVREGQAIDSGDYAYVAFAFGARAEVAIVEGLFLSARVGGAVPFTRRGLFVEDADAPIWREPPITGLASLGLGWAFF